jgi:toxin ParE1/3/4
MRGIVLRPKARQDLREIWNYTLQTWGPDQADEYLQQIQQALEKIAEAPLLGSDRGYVRPGLRKISAGSHAVYYFHDDRIVRVSRILHGKRDAEREL